MKTVVKASNEIENRTAYKKIAEKLVCIYLRTLKWNTFINE